MGVISDLAESSCAGCGELLTSVVYFEREPVVYTGGEFAGEKGTAVVALHGCGMTSVIPWTADGPSSS